MTKGGFSHSFLLKEHFFEGSPAMSKDSLKAELYRLLEPVVKEEGLELVRLDFNVGRKAHLAVYIDKPGGVTISDCETVSRALSDQLDAYDPIPQSYILEVSSPGVERPLTGAGDFQRFQGEAVKVYTAEPVDGKKYFQGKLSAAGEEYIEIILENEERIEIPLDQIKKAHLWFQP